MTQRRGSCEVVPVCWVLATLPCWFWQVGAMVSVFVTMSALLALALQPSQGKAFIFLFIFGLEVIHHRPEGSINYSNGGREGGEAFERQIHLDLIGKQVSSLPLSRFPIRWRDGAIYLASPDEERPALRSIVGDWEGIGASVMLVFRDHSHKGSGCHVLTGCLG